MGGENINERSLKIGCVFSIILFLLAVSFAAAPTVKAKDNPQSIPNGPWIQPEQTVKLERFLQPEELNRELKKIEKNAVKGRMELEKIGESNGFNHDIYVVKFGEPAPDKTKILIDSQIHGDEACGTEAIVNIIREMATTKSKKIEKVLDEVTVWFVPQINPDGATLFETEDGSQSMSRQNVQEWTPTEWGLNLDHPAPWYHYPVEWTNRGKPGYDMNRDANPWLDFRLDEIDLTDDLRIISPKPSASGFYGTGTAKLGWTEDHKVLLYQEGCDSTIDVDVTIETNESITDTETVPVNFEDSYGSFNVGNSTSNADFVTTLNLTKVNTLSVDADGLKGMTVSMDPDKHDRSWLPSGWGGDPGFYVTPEVRALSNVFQELEPDLYINHHHKYSDLVPDTKEMCTLQICSQFVSLDFEYKAPNGKTYTLDKEDNILSDKVNAYVYQQLQKGNSPFGQITKYPPVEDFYGGHGLPGTTLASFSMNDAAVMLYETRGQQHPDGHTGQKASGMYIKQSEIGLWKTIVGFAEGEIQDVDPDYYEEEIPPAGPGISNPRKDIDDDGQEEYLE